METFHIFFTLQGFINWTLTVVELENEVIMSFIPESNEFIIISTNNDNNDNKHVLLAVIIPEKFQM